MSWFESVNRMVEYSGMPQSKKIKNELHLATVIDALRGWLESEITEYTEGSYEGVSRRMVWVFPDNWAVTVGYKTFTLVHLDKEITSSEPLILPASYQAKDTFFLHAINGWSLHKSLTNQELIDFIDGLTEIHGIPNLCLPWDTWINQTVDDDEYVSYWDDKEQLPVRQGFYNLMVLINDSKLQSLVKWEIIICEDDDFMSEYSDYSRFTRLTSELEESGRWMVILDEHCAACSSGTRKYMIEENPALANAPEFLTWGQNSQDTWMPDGTFWAEVWIDGFEAEKEVKILANKHGFFFEIPENEDEAEGTISFD